MDNSLGSYWRVPFIRAIIPHAYGGLALLVYNCGQLLFNSYGLKYSRAENKTSHFNVIKTIFLCTMRVPEDCPLLDAIVTSLKDYQDNITFLPSRWNNTLDR